MCIFQINVLVKISTTIVTNNLVLQLQSVPTRLVSQSQSSFLIVKYVLLRYKLKSIL